MVVRARARRRGVRRGRRGCRVRRGRDPPARRADRRVPGGGARHPGHRALARAGHRHAGLLATDGGLGRAVRLPPLAHRRPGVRRGGRRAARAGRAVSAAVLGDHRGGAVLLLLFQAPGDRPARHRVGQVHVLHRAVPARRLQRAVVRVQRVRAPGQVGRVFRRHAERVQHRAALPVHPGDVLPRLRPRVPHAVPVHAQAEEVRARARQAEEGVREGGEKARSRESAEQQPRR
mmetsp:Transcript_10718/g.44963  ORF Transcript_10718/g.44963 Transcript_10718/m.44963 type:complete len:233 (+) Transcript_10718:111-809(+)